MECLLIPLILGLLAIPFMLWAKHHNWDEFGPCLATIILCISFVTSLICSPITYLESRDKSWVATDYYELVLKPHMVEEKSEYIVVSGLEQGIWQISGGGGMNLSTYNAYLRVERYWDSIPIIGSVFYTPPKYLKMARVK